MAALSAQTKRPVVIRWYESWIIRAAAMASFILFFGYAMSAFFAFESIDSIAKLAHDKDIEDNLGAHLQSIKKTHALEQELISERLLQLLPPDTPTHSAAEIRALLSRARIGDLTQIKEIKITAAAPEGQLRASAPKAAPASGLRWLDRDRLQLEGYVLEFPKGQTYESFKSAEDVLQRYQLIGAKLDDQIRPLLVRATTAVLLVTFLLLVIIFVFYAQRFKAKVGEVIAGFITWSERDAQFRFSDRYPGELRQITAQFNAMANEVETNRQRSLYLEKIASWQIIARKLAHEIKNPLTPIQMMVSQLKRRYKGEDPDFGRLLDDAQSIISEEVAGLRRMVDNFSNFARLPEPEPRPTDLVTMCRHTLELQRNAFAQHQFAFNSLVAKATAMVDEDLIRQVLINLIKNAAEACGETPSEISVELTELGQDFAISVKDNGPGIPAELKDRIFEAYFTTKHTGPSPGMGLGLAVCQKIVLDHAGKMTVKSRPGETVFTIRLPQRKKDV